MLISTSTGAHLYCILIATNELLTNLFSLQAQPGPLQDNTSPKVSFGEEAFAYTLPPGAYFLKTRLYPQQRQSLPSAVDCGFYPAEAAIVPIQTLANNPLVGQVT